MHRLFLAINFSDEIKRTIGTYARSVGPLLDGARPAWVDPRIYHLTLHFFGEVDDTFFPTARLRLADLARKTQAPRLSPAGIGYLPSQRSPRVVYLNLAVTPRDALTPLIEGVRSLAAGTGAANETRPWRAHLTLARLKQPRVPPQAALPRPPDFWFSPASFDLMESFLSSKGPRYEVRERYEFA